MIGLKSRAGANYIAQTGIIDKLDLVSVKRNMKALILNIARGQFTQ